MSYKHERLKMVKEDLENTLVYQDEYKEIQNLYFNAKTEEDWNKAIQLHENLNEVEVDLLLKWQRKLKEMKFGVR